MTEQWVVDLAVDIPDDAVNSAHELTLKALPLLEALAPVAKSRPGRIEFELVTESPSLSAAADHVTTVWTDVAPLLGLEPEQGSVVSVVSTAQTAAASDRLVGVAELAAMLSVSKTRARQLAEYAEFPAPLVKLAATPVWAASAVRRFADERGRVRSGR